MTNGTSLPIPDLPTPITTPDPVESDPSQLPVESELDPASPANPLSVKSARSVATAGLFSSRIRSFHSAVKLRFTANREFMRVAAFRWPNVKESMPQT